jgi:hypothetical protein
MNKIDIIFIYLIIIISFACIIKIYLNNKKIERFYSFNTEFSGVMKFIDAETENYLGSFPHFYDECFQNENGFCEYNSINYKYNAIDETIKLKNDDGNPDKVIKVSIIKLPKGDKGDNGSEAKQPTINFYYKNKNDDIVNENGGIEYKPFYTVVGDQCTGNCPDDITVNVNKYECSCEPCGECSGNVKINTITSIQADPEDNEVGTAIRVTGNINTGQIILEDGGEICIDQDGTKDCLTYSDIKLLLQWNSQDCLDTCIN